MRVNEFIVLLAVGGALSAAGCSKTTTRNQTEIGGGGEGGESGAGGTASGGSGGSESGASGGSLSSSSGGTGAGGEGGDGEPGDSSNAGGTGGVGAVNGTGGVDGTGGATGTNGTGGSGTGGSGTGGTGGSGEVCESTGAEVCNGLDDDCNGEIDDGSAQELGCTNLEVCDESCVCAAALCRGGYASWPMPGTPGHARDYQVSADTVLDRVTGLEWQRTVSPDSFTWAQAQTYCSDLALNGKSDWRVPSRVELISLLDFSKETPPSIDHEAFPNTPAEVFWTASTDANNDANGWVVRFSGGSPTPDDFSKTALERARCVRTAIHTPPLDTQFVNHGNGTVTDLGTGLMWLEASQDANSLAAAESFCEQLSFASFTDWRLPTATELLTQIDESRINPAIDPVAFPGSQGNGYYATATKILGEDGNAWSVHLYRGETFIQSTTSGKDVRCVRNSMP